MAGQRRGRKSALHRGVSIQVDPVDPLWLWLVRMSGGLAFASQGGEGIGFELGVSCVRKIGY